MEHVAANETYLAATVQRDEGSNHNALSVPGR